MNNIFKILNVTKPFKSKIYVFLHLITPFPKDQWTSLLEKGKWFFFLIFKIYLLIYLWLCWVFFSVRARSLVVASAGHSSSRCAGLSLSRPLLLRSTGSRRASSVIVAHGLSCSAACGIFPDQGSNLCALHWQADSQPLRHQGSLGNDFWNQPLHCFPFKSFYPWN